MISQNCIDSNLTHPNLMDLEGTKDICSVTHLCHCSVARFDEYLQQCSVKQNNGVMLFTKPVNIQQVLKRLKFDIQADVKAVVTLNRTHSSNALPRIL